LAGITLAHTFVSAKGNGTDLTLIQPSNWNDQHAIKLDPNMLLGKLTAGNGPVEQIPLSAFMATLLNAASAQALANLIGGFTTGDGKITLKTTADTGWVMCNDGTIGSASSGATTFADPSTQALFTLLYNNISDAGAPVYTSGGAASTRAAQGSVSAAWAANCRLQLPLQLGRAIISAGAGSGLTARALGTAFGEQTHTLTANEIPTISSINNNSPNYILSSGATASTANGLTTNTTGGGAFTFNTFTGFSPVSVTGFINIGLNTLTTASNNTGGTAPTHNNMQPSAAWNVMVKL
jgi:microcystin-dependent protein